MRLPLALLLLATWVAPTVVAAQDVVPAAPGQAATDSATGTGEPRTGDAWVDTWMDDLDRYAERYPGAFVDELVRYRGAPRPLAEQLLADPAWRPADLYVACATAQALGRTCREVSLAWQQNRSAGWAATVEGLDAERHREAMARVKRGLVESYDRWARPIRLDASLRRAFPDRGE